MSLHPLWFPLLLIACGTPAPDAPPPARPEAPAPAEVAASPGTILSAYYGLDELPLPIVRLCPGDRALGADGMPVTFSERLQPKSVTPEMFVVETATGEKVTPLCATLRPADESLENRTVLLAGPFGTGAAQPKSVEVVGDLLDTDGRTLKGLRTTAITPLEAGPSLLLAERFSPDTAGLSGECPADTSQVVQLTWEGGVTGPDGADLDAPQRTAIEVLLADGTTVSPLALADDDPDNFVHVCLNTAVEAQKVSVKAGFFHDPGDDANPATAMDVVAGTVP